MSVEEDGDEGGGEKALCHQCICKFYNAWVAIFILLVEIEMGKWLLLIMTDGLRSGVVNPYEF